MKKLLCSFTMLLALASPSFAASWKDAPYNPNEVSVEYGRISLIGIGTVLGAAFGAAFSGGLATPDKVQVSGAVGLSYYRWFGPHFALGCESAYEHSVLHFKNSGSSQTTPSGNNYISLMPSLKARWVQTDGFGFYSRVSGGGCLNIIGASTTTTTDTSTNTTNTTTTPASASAVWAFQISPLGFEFGKLNIRGFAELGFGMQGMILGGMRYSF